MKKYLHSLLQRTFKHRVLHNRVVQLLVLIATGLAVVWIGALGFAFENKLDLFESQFWSIGFLTLNNFNLSPAGNGKQLLFFARLLGILFFLVTTFTVVWAYLGNRFLCWLLNEHIVIIGMGWRGRNIAENLLSTKAGKQIVIVDTKFDEATLEWCALNSIATVNGDALERETLEEAQVGKAKTIYIFCDDDTISIQVASLAAELCKAPAGFWKSVDDLRAAHPDAVKLEAAAQAEVDAWVLCYIELKSQRSFESVTRALDKAESRLRPQLINMEAVTARSLIDTYPIDRFTGTFADAPVSHVVVIGDTSMAKELLRQAIQLGIYEKEPEGGAREKRLHLSTMVTDPKKFTDCLVEFYPAFDRSEAPSGTCIEIVPRNKWVSDDHILPQIDVHKLPVSNAEILDSEKGLPHVLFPPAIGLTKQVITVYVAMDGGIQSLDTTRSIATQLDRIKREREVDIKLYFFVTNRNLAFKKQVRKGFEELAIKPIPFDEFMGDFSASNLIGASLNDLAKRLNWMYCDPAGYARALAENSRAPDSTRHPVHDVTITNLAEKLWRDSSEGDKDSSRQAAAHSRVKLRIAKRLGLAEGSLEERQVLAQIEHRRWCAELLLKGYRPLIRPPSQPDSEAFSGIFPARSAEELIAQWRSREQPLRKDQWKSERRHLDLIPFQDLRTLLGAEFGKAEELKDHDQIAMVLPYVRSLAASAS